MEFKLISPNEDGFRKAITFNKEEIKEDLKDRIREIIGKNYGMSQIREARYDRATLNIFREAIERKRKEVKKKWMKPYEKFKEDINELLEILDKPINDISWQIKKLELEKEELARASIKIQHPAPEKEICEIQFKVYVTQEQKEKLKKFLIENEIEYFKIEKDEKKNGNNKFIKNSYDV
ncbi:MAG: DUF1351 domain-containing protein [Endomicrobium sp.]|jgi:hypothetical protein|nr:DUF1351 domain-containing protein [Endomicrobium sp.]